MARGKKSSAQLDREINAVLARTSSDFDPNAIITYTDPRGRVLHRELVICETRGSAIAAGPCYTQVEWEAGTAADWEYDGEGRLLYQGKPGGPYANTTYAIRKIS